MEETLQEFDEDEVLALVAKALESKGQDAFRVITKLPLSFGDTIVLEKLDSILSKYFNKADVQMVLHELRDIQLTGFPVDKTLEQLHLITKNCRRCPDAIPGATIPFWNVTDPDVVFVTDTPYFDPSSMEYFTKTASGVGFTSSRLCMTFVNRCLKKSKTKHSQEEIQSCIPYLHNELQVLRPKLVVPLGLIATCSLLPAKIHMNEERGRIVWLGPWPILPTFSPSYVLRGAGNLPQLFEQDLQKAYNFVYGEK